LTHAEREFLDRIYERGEVAPELLTNDARLQAVIREHPGILWKLQNSREA
jgi:hypothetical protein